MTSERAELEQLRAEQAQRAVVRDPGPPPILPSVASLPSLARLLGIDVLVTSAAWQNRAMSALLAAPRWVDPLMASLADLNTAVSRVRDDVATVKTSIDDAVGMLRNVGNLTADQQAQLDQAVSTLTEASTTLEQEQSALSAAEQPPAPPAPPAPQGRR